jgi:sigma-B regulation protein RsbU (phosphoserine phosphatase)
MLANIVATYHSQFEVLAKAWLTSGASVFEVWGQGARLACWPDQNATSTARLSELIFVDGIPVAELRVATTPTKANFSRLKAEANLVSHLVKLASNLDSVTNELIDVQDQLLAVYDLAKAVEKEATLAEEMQRLVKRASRLVKTEASFLMFDMPSWPTSIEYHPGPLMDSDSMDSILKIVQATGEEVLLDREETAKLSLSFDNLLLMPIRVRDGVYAVLGLINKIGGNFLSPDIKLARAISEHIGTRIEHTLLNEQSVEQASFQSELELAQRVHFNLLTRQLPRVAGLDIWASSRPALQFGGDFYDFFMQPSQALSFAVGDVSGKGLPAALLMAITRTVFRTKTSDMPDSTPELVMVGSNEELYDAFTRVNMFATVFLGQYDVEDRKMLYANAGHSPVIFRPADSDAQLLQADSTAIGILPTNQPENQQLEFQPGDLLVVGTDGLNEAHNERDEMFGLERLLSFVNSVANKPAKEIADDLYHAVERFSAGHPQYDDQTIMVIKGVAA